MSISKFFYIFLIFLLLFLGTANGAVASAELLVSLDPPRVAAGKTVRLVMTIRRPIGGESETYRFLPPEITLPEGIVQQGMSSQAEEREDFRETRYVATLLPSAQGTFSFTPVKISYMLGGETYTLESNAVTLTVTGLEIAGYAWWIPVTFGAAVVVLAVIAIALLRRQKKKKLTEATNTTQRVDLNTPLGACSRYRMEGDFARFYETLQEIIGKLPERIGSEIGELSPTIEQIKYGGYAPDKEAMEQLYRRVERAVAQENKKP